MALNPETVEKIIENDEPEANLLLRLLVVRLRKESEGLKKYAEWIISQADDNIKISEEIAAFLTRSNNERRAEESLYSITRNGSQESL